MKNKREGRGIKQDFEGQRSGGRDKINGGAGLGLVGE